MMIMSLKMVARRKRVKKGKPEVRKREAGRRRKRGKMIVEM